MRILGFFSDLEEFLDVITAFSLLIYMWIRSHIHLKRKINKLDEQFSEFDEYSSKKFSKIMQHLRENQIEEKEVKPENKEEA